MVVFLRCLSLWLCLYEAPSPDAIVTAARRANVPADEVVEVGPASVELSGRLREWADSQAGAADL